MAKQTKIKKFELATLNVDQIVELDGWIEKRSTVIKESPFVVIDNPETYKTAKRNRTALKSFRTTVEKQDRTIGTFLSQFRKSTKVKSLDLVENEKEGTIHHENKQQIEIDRWEKIIQEKKDEEAKIEDERIAGIKGKIEDVKLYLKTRIDEMKFNTVEGTRQMMTEEIDDKLRGVDFDEFDFLFEEMVNEHWNFFNQKEEQLITVEEDRLDQIEKDQESKINQVFVDHTKMIDEFKFDSGKNITDEVMESLFAIEFDFGEFKSKFEEMKVSFRKKANGKFDELKDEQKRHEEKEIESQKSSVVKLREGSLDLIFQMTVENHKCETGKINGTWEQDFTASVPLAMDEVLKARQMINKSLDRKLSEIAEDLQKLEDEKIAKENKAKEDFKIRSKQLIKLGLKLDSGIFSGFGVGTCQEMFKNTSDEDFNKQFELIKTEIRIFKMNDKKIKAKDKRIKSERESLIDWIDNGIRKTSMSRQYKQPEMIESKKHIQSELNALCDQLIEKLNSI